MVFIGFHQLGDRVTWTSQAGGYTTTKEGVVVEIVPPGQKPKAKLKEPGLARHHPSYVVKVGNRFYWPRVAGLAPVPPAPQENKEDE